MVFGVVTPHGVRGRLVAVLATGVVLVSTARRRSAVVGFLPRLSAAMRGWITLLATLVVHSPAAATCTTAL